MTSSLFFSFNSFLSIDFFLLFSFDFGLLPLLFSFLCGQSCLLFQGSSNGICDSGLSSDHFSCGSLFFLFTSKLLNGQFCFLSSGVSSLLLGKSSCFDVLFGLGSLSLHLGSKLSLFGKILLEFSFSLCLGSSCCFLICFSLQFLCYELCLKFVLRLC